MTANPSTKVNEYRTFIPATVEAVWAFHEHPKAFKRLTPPPVFIQVLHNTLTSLKNGEVEFNMWIGPVPIRWVARHEPGPIETSFIDRQLKGPLATWEHQHILQRVDGGVMLIDHITLAHKPGWRGWLSRLFFDGLPLRLLFFYRHRRTHMGVK
ncbi:MAG: SRPBCC family protein [Chloroflexi bacterium]|nr:SRPBCC family protein [Chloroflexota bacterium]